MNLRRKRPADSLYMLLDTMCNAFGGIILLAVMVTLLTSKERGSQTETSHDTKEMLQRRLALAQTSLEHSLQLFASLQAKATDDRWRKQVALLATRKEVQEALQQIRDAVSQSSRELDTVGAADPAERLKFLNAQLAAAEARKLEQQNSLSAARENSKRLKQRLDSLQQQVAKIINESQRPLRLPKEHETGKRPFYVIVQYGRIYPCRNADLSRNESTITWSSRGESDTAKPIPDQGYSPADAAKLQALFNSLPKDLVYLAFCVFEDSFPEFNRAKGIAMTSGLAYGWDPFRNQDGPVSFSPIGHRPKPQ
jgi:hypothetical protein